MECPIAKLWKKVLFFYGYALIVPCYNIYIGGLDDAAVFENCTSC